MTTEHDNEKMLHKYFSDEQIVCLDYVADRAAGNAISDAMITHGRNCPFKQQVSSVGVKVFVDTLAVLVVLGSLGWGVLKSSAEKSANEREVILQKLEQVQAAQGHNAKLAATDRDLHAPQELIREPRLP